MMPIMRTSTALVWPTLSPVRKTVVPASIFSRPAHLRGDSILSFLARLTPSSHGLATAPASARHPERLQPGALTEAHPDTSHLLSRTPATHPAAISTVYTPILIVGAGPTGIVLSALLNQMRVPHILADKDNMLENALQNTFLKPAVLSHRTMETWFREPITRRETALASKTRLVLLSSVPSVLRSFGQPNAEHCPSISKGNACAVAATSLETLIPSNTLSPRRWKTDVPLNQPQEHTAKANSPNLFQEAPSRFLPLKGSFSPCRLGFLSEQPLLFQSLLRNEVKKGLAQDAWADGVLIGGDAPDSTIPPSCRLFLGWEWIGAFPGSLGVVSFLHSKDPNRHVVCQSGFLIGADGAHSAIRQVLMETEGVRMEDIHHMGSHPCVLQAQLSCEALSNKSSSGFCQKNLMYQIFTSEGPVHVSILDTRKGTIRMTYPLISVHQRQPDQISQKLLIKKFSTLGKGRAGATTAFDIQSVHQRLAANVLASRFRDATTGRILLLGDAAHSSPLWGCGCGSIPDDLNTNCGVADAANLAWKLATIYHRFQNHYADPKTLQGSPIDPKGSRLLESYAAERYYAAQYTLNIANQQTRKVMVLSAALGFDWNWLHKVSKRLTAFMLQWKKLPRILAWPLPAICSSVFFCCSMTQAIKFHFYEKIWRRIFRKRTQMLVENSQVMPDFILPGADLAYAYGNSPLAPEVKQGPAYLRIPADPKFVTPTTLKGCRVPHSWVITQGTSKYFLLSTVDLPLLSFDRTRFTLLLLNSLALDLVVKSLWNTLLKHQHELADEISTQQEELDKSKTSSCTGIESSMIKLNRLLSCLTIAIWEDAPEHQDSISLDWQAVIKMASESKLDGLQKDYPQLECSRLDSMAEAVLPQLHSKTISLAGPQASTTNTHCNVSWVSLWSNPETYDEKYDKRSLLLSSIHL